MNNKSAVSFHPQPKDSGSHSTRLIDLHGKLEGIIHISNKEIRYQMFSKYEKELAKKFDEAKA